MWKPCIQALKRSLNERIRPAPNRINSPALKKILPLRDPKVETLNFSLCRLHLAKAIIQISVFSQITDSLGFGSVWFVP